MTDLTVGNYNLYKIPLNFRTALSRLRCSVHSLHVEVGRHENIPTEYTCRVCYMCNSHDVEDEYHFIMSCSAYDNLQDL